MEVAIEADPDGNLNIGSSRVLFDDSHFETCFLGAFINYDVASDDRFVMVKKSPPTHINVILNFDEELKRLAPIGKK